MRNRRGRPRVPVAAETVQQMKAAGMSYRKIALRLGISPRTARRRGAARNFQTAQSIDQDRAMQPANFAPPCEVVL